MGCCCCVSEEVSQSEKNRIKQLVEQYGKSNTENPATYAEVKVELAHCHSISVLNWR